jgi:ARD/ARD' family
MVRVWFMDDDTTSDQRLEHQRDPPEFIDVKQLFELTGVEYFKVNYLLMCEESFQKNVVQFNKTFTNCYLKSSKIILIIFFVSKSLIRSNMRKTGNLIRFVKKEITRMKMR